MSHGRMSCGVVSVHRKVIACSGPPRTALYDVKNVYVTGARLSWMGLHSDFDCYVAATMYCQFMVPFQEKEADS